MESNVSQDSALRVARDPAGTVGGVSHTHDQCHHTGNLFGDQNKRSLFQTLLTGVLWAEEFESATSAHRDSRNGNHALRGSRLSQYFRSIQQHFSPWMTAGTPMVLHALPGQQQREVGGSAVSP